MAHVYRVYSVGSPLRPPYLKLARGQYEASSGSEPGGGLAVAPVPVPVPVPGPGDRCGHIRPGLHTRYLRPAAAPGPVAGSMEHRPGHYRINGTSTRSAATVTWDV